MASPRKRLLSVAALAVLGMTGYYLYSVFAAQGQGTLAQAPLNIQAGVKPAFIMAVDDSGSMTFETMLPGQDGQACWTGTSFFSSGTTLSRTGTCGYNHLIPFTGHRIDANRHAIPPIDAFGFARSSEVNPSYFDPSDTYTPWLKGDGTPYAATTGNPAGNASLTATRTDPRDTAPLINLTALRSETATDLRFRVLNGMKLPAGTEYYATASCGGLGTTTGTRNTWVTLGAQHTVTANCQIGIRYFPATFYLKTTTAAPAGYRTAVVAPGVIGGRSLAAGACGTGCDMYRYEIKPGNYTSTAAYDQAIQSFANWFSYYGNRNRAMIAGMTLSLSDVENMRIGYFTINNRVAVAMRDMATAGDKTALYNSVLSLPASGSTPNLFAVNHIGTQFLRTDAGAPVQLACQKNAGMLFTDGYSNQGSPGAPAITGMGAPFDPTPADSMAAIATKYYQATLRSGAGFPAGKVPVPSGCSDPSPDPRLDCRADPHMNFYGVTLGARGNIFDPAVDRDPFVAPYPAWTGHANDQPQTVDDIWHASVNTRGEYINAQTPAAITEAMRRILASVGGGTTPSGTLALTGSRIGVGSLTVIPEYTSANNGTDWYSKLTAQTISSTFATGVSYATLWEASTKLPAGARNTIWLAKNAAGVKPTVTQLSSTSLTLAQLCSDALATCTQTGTKSIAVKLGATIDEAIAYLKGDASQEVNGTSGKLRKRTTRLGDIVNSTPVVSAPTDDFGYQSLRTSATVYDALNYKAYLESKKTRATMVYAGANDGMLHAFNGASGVEQFAYIPTTSWGHMGNLLFPYDIEDRNFQVFDHRYFVDGPINVSDVHDGAWKTVLVGTSGAGGRSVFAIDVTQPTVFNGTKVLWELNDTVSSTTIKNNIGHVLGKPVIVPVKESDGTIKWKAIFGNGYGSNSGNATLFVVDIGSGTTQVITAEESGGPSMNGLGNIVAIDRYVGTSDSRGRDGYVDTVYGGDQNGAVWKFDLRTGANLVTPFFVATDKAGGRQAILGGFEAASGPGGGVMIYFGTGSFSFGGDPDDKQLQTVYGVLDTAFGSNPPTTTLVRNDLQQQRVKTDTDGNRTLTTDGLTFGVKGWLLDLGVTTTAGVTTETGERSVGNPVVTSGVVFFPTFDPNTSDSCATGGVNRLYGLNALSGGGALSQARVGAPDGALPAAGTGAIKLETTGSAPIKDVAVLTTPRGGPLAADATAAEILAAANQRCTMTVQVAGAPPLYLPRPCGRQSWRQVR